MLAALSRCYDCAAELHFESFYECHLLEHNSQKAILFLTPPKNASGWQDLQNGASVPLPLAELSPKSLESI